MVDKMSSNNGENDFKVNAELHDNMNKHICPVSDNYYSKCPVMRSYYYLVEEFFSAWSWSG